MRSITSIADQIISWQRDSKNSPIELECQRWIGHAQPQDDSADLSVELKKPSSVPSNPRAARWALSSPWRPMMSNA